MIALLRKDFFLGLPVTLFLVVLFVALPTVFPLFEYVNWEAFRPMPVDEIANALIIGTMAALGTSVIVIPAFGGVAFARERRDRSADYLSALPIARARIVASKVCVTLAQCATPWIATAFFFLAAYAAWPEFSSWKSWQDQHAWAEIFKTIALLQLGLLGLSWLLSTVLRSEVLATALAILIAIILALTWGYVTYRLDQRGDAGDLPVWIGVGMCISIGAGGLIAGTIIALRRTSP